jgi:hypothetical protein
VGNFCYYFNSVEEEAEEKTKLGGDSGIGGISDGSGGIANDGEIGQEQPGFKNTGSVVL